MSKNAKKQQKTSVETQNDALKIAKGTQKPGQSKEQTKLIAQGIQKGIELYKKQQKEKSRELNKKLKKVSSKLSQQDSAFEIESEAEIIVQQSRLPWVLLLLSWLGFIVLFFRN
ncbi:MAG: DUF2956 domain-containing protein [Methyloprofundus sp.]|nr:DUF2956 domain-containing protein [Methyloprofundus sp.]